MKRQSVNRAKINRGGPKINIAITATQPVSGSPLESLATMVISKNAKMIVGIKVSNKDANPGLTLLLNFIVAKV